LFKVMIVDDMEVLRRDIKRSKLWGEDSGFVIAEEAENGLDALEKLESNSMDLIITDIRMPKMDGIELLRSVAEKKLGEVTVLFSDFTEYSYARQGFLYGAFDYLSKPVNDIELANLLDRIKKHLNEKNEQERKLQILQEVAERNLFIEDDTKQIVAQIQNGDYNKATLSFSSLIDKLSTQYDSEYLKIPISVQNAMHGIIDETMKNHDWLEKFVDADALKAVDYSACCGNLEEVKKMANHVLEKLGTVINRLMGCHENKIVRQACEHTLKHIEEEISVKALSEKLFLNKSYLSETFKQEYGITLSEYITIVKIERAKMLLAEGNIKNYQIAERLGFKDVEYFGRLFKKYTGMPLKEYGSLGTLKNI